MRLRPWMRGRADGGGVELVGRDAHVGSDIGTGGTEALPASHPILYGDKGRLEIGGWWRGGSRDDHRHLPPDTAGGPLGELRQAATPHLLVRLGQLSADSSRPVGAEGGRHRGKHLRRPVRRLEHNQRSRLSRELGQPPIPGSRPARQEALEAEPVDRQARHGQRCGHRRRPRDDGDRHPGLDCRGDQSVAGVGDAGHTGVGHQQHTLAGDERLDQLDGAPLLVALEVGHQPPGHGDPQVGGQPAQPPGVLGCDHVRGDQLVDQARRRVGGPADRRTRDHESHPGIIAAPPYDVAVPTTPSAATSHGGASPTPTALLGRDVDAEGLPRLRRRFTPLHFSSDVGRGWIAPILVTIFVGIFQFIGITNPHDISFDETYYAKDAYSLLVKHYADSFVDNPSTPNVNEADEIIDSGSTKGIFTDQPEMVVHPEVGKWMIAFGEWAFGMTPFGWRFSSAFIGTLMILVMCRLMRRLTGSTLLGCVAGLLLGFDGLHFVMSRFALLDIFLAFWLLCATHCLVADRDWARARMAQRFETSPGTRQLGFGPIRGLLWRPWRVAAGVCFGLACGTKWSGVFVLAGLGVLSWAWDCGMRRALGVRLAVVKSFLVDGLPAFVSVVVIGFLVYVASWMGFLIHAQLFEDAFGHANQPHETNWSSVNDYGGHPHGPIEGALHDLDILWNYHIAVYDFHTGAYINAAHHPYQSNPGGWPLINRPIGVAATSGGPAQVVGCPPGEQCVRQVLAIGTPALWWGGVIALIAGAGYWLSKRDWRFGIPVVGVLTTWLPWFRYDQRPIFFYYAVAIIPFTVMAVTLLLGKVIGPADATRIRRTWGVVFAGAFFFLVALNFVYFYPILSNGLLSNQAWNDRMWFTHWI